MLGLINPSNKPVSFHTDRRSPEYGNGRFSVTRPSSGASWWQRVPATNPTSSRKLRIECARVLWFRRWFGLWVISGSVILLSTFVPVFLLPDEFFVFHLRFQVSMVVRSGLPSSSNAHRRESSVRVSLFTSNGFSPAHALPLSMMCARCRTSA